MCSYQTILSAEVAYIVTWRLNLEVEAQKNKFSLIEISEYLHQQTQLTKSCFYADSLFKHKVNLQILSQHLYEKNQSIAGYKILYISELWRFTQAGIRSNVLSFVYENPNLPPDDPYKNLYVSSKFIPTMLREIKLSGYYQGRASIPLGEWIKKHDFEYTILKSSPSLPGGAYVFVYEQSIDEQYPKKTQILFDFFPQKNIIFGHTYVRDKTIEENFMYTPQYKNESQNQKFRDLLLTFMQRNKLLKHDENIEDMLQSPANFVFYFDALVDVKGLEWISLRVYLTAGKSPASSYIQCAFLSQNKIKSLDNFLKRSTGLGLSEYFLQDKVDFLVSYINNSFANNAEDGLVLKNYLLEIRSR
ncbi:MAG: hypothetical protein RML94_13180 [Bacteroidia bacterium]|nr:hypothetical protein [Bacteroidia bacterium]